ARAATASAPPRRPRPARGSGAHDRAHRRAPPGPAPQRRRAHQPLDREARRAQAAEPARPAPGPPRDHPARPAFAREARGRAPGRAPLGVAAPPRRALGGRVVSMSEELGDFTTSTRVIPMTMLAATIGAIAAFVALGLLKAIALFTNLFF